MGNNNQLNFFDHPTKATRSGTVFKKNRSKQSDYNYQSRNLKSNKISASDHNSSPEIQSLVKSKGQDHIKSNIIIKKKHHKKNVSSSFSRNIEKNISERKLKISKRIH